MISTKCPRCGLPMTQTNLTKGKKDGGKRRWVCTQCPKPVYLSGDENLYNGKEVRGVELVRLIHYRKELLSYQYINLNTGINERTIGRNLKKINSRTTIDIDNIMQHTYNNLQDCNYLENRTNKVIGFADKEENERLREIVLKTDELMNLDYEILIIDKYRMFHFIREKPSLENLNEQEYEQFFIQHVASHLILESFSENEISDVLGVEYKRNDFMKEDIFLTKIKIETESDNGLNHDIFFFNDDTYDSRSIDDTHEFYMNLNLNERLISIKSIAKPNKQYFK